MKAEKPPRTANNDMPAAKGTGRRLVAINSKAGKKETSKNIHNGKQQTLASFFSRPAVQFPPVSQLPKRKPLLPLNLPNVNVPKKRAADPAAKSKANSRTSRSAKNSKGYRWILANSLPNLTLPFHDSNYLLLCSSKNNPHKKSALRAEVRT